MNLTNACRKKVKMKMAIQGPSGSGKTIGSILVAKGLCDDWDSVAVIDSENHSASLYSNIGRFKVLNITAPFTPEKYIEAINICARAGMQVIIIDSVSHLWDGSGGVLDIHNSMAGNSFANWSKVMPRFNAFVQAVLQVDSHVICTFRTKQDYVLVEKNGRQVPEKVGLKSITKEGMDYEFTLVFDLDIKHHAVATKDRTGLFMDKPDTKLSSLIGEMISNWCNEGEEKVDLISRVNSCKTIGELLELYEMFPDSQNEYQAIFRAKKVQLQQKINQNGQTALVN
jgi:hypothetical protein